MALVGLVVELALAVAAAALVFNLLAYADAAADRRRRPPDCAADEDGRPDWAGRVRAFAFECVATSVLAWASPRVLMCCNSRISSRRRGVMKSVP